LRGALEVLEFETMDSGVVSIGFSKFDVNDFVLFEKVLTPPSCQSEIVQSDPFVVKFVL
jgi:hypothetical protein